ncbi:Non-heme chloroperoxidase [Variovorax sp. PBS-H4]|uniref:alpha/beta fold hydrolase n=1 Tax=Variovorax sp. PBS-H4 TaxID=434008 RepID=UPI001316DDFF|nr:alpha/beta hydrolase [Variovorax sp. PBS-H4]VTU18193.1 Non-heme chloroperoxidase [Variovorax sp. PBS-H4]
MPHITANGVRTFYRTLGQGPALLLIAGNGMDHTAFDEQLPVFAEHFRCIVYDLRGIGSSEVPASGYTPREMAEDALALLSALEIEQAHIAGYSLGGAIAQEMALAQPQRVLSLSLYSSYERPLPYMRLRYDILIKVVEETTPELWAMYSAFSAFGPEFINAHERALRNEIAKRIDRWEQGDAPSRIGLAGHYRAILAHDTAERLCDIRCPAWIAVGSADAVTPAWHSQRMHQLIAGSTLSVFPGKPHRILNFEAEEFTRDALAFLLKHKNAA